MSGRRYSGLNDRHREAVLAPKNLAEQLTDLLVNQVRYPPSRWGPRTWCGRAFHVRHAPARFGHEQLTRPLNPTDSDRIPKKRRAARKPRKPDR